MPTPELPADTRTALTPPPLPLPTLTGTEGDDTLVGTDSAEQIRGLGGNDRLSGGSGADWIWGDLGDDTIDGGDGDDILLDNGGNNTIRGGRGDDIVYVGGNGSGSLSWTVDGGDGNDSVSVIFFGAALPARVSATGGAGRDTYTVQWSADPGADVLTIHDFTTGTNGDILDFGQLSAGLPPLNPFAAGSGLRLVQNGADTVVQLPGVDRGASGMSGTVVLKNVAKEALSFANFAYGFDPTGSTAGKTLGGGEGDDEIFGSAFDDTITGAGGADRLAGGLGDDRLEGGAGDDILDGDAFYRWRSQSWDPYLNYQAGHDVLDGGDGNDKLRSSWGNDVLRGGAGNDELRLAYAISQQEAHQVRLHGDAGADHFILEPGLNPWLRVDMEGGAGSDLFTIGGLLHMGAMTITDFTPGQGGDVLDLFGIASWHGATPFADGTYRVVQSGADTIVQLGRYDLFQDIVRLKDVDKNTLSHANFAGGYAPDGSTTGILFVGGPGNDTYTGGALDDTILGGAGDDVLDGSAGQDILAGGTGNDRIDGGAGRDTVHLEADLSNYRITRSDAGIQVTGLGAFAAEGTDILTGVERIVFGNGGLAFDADGAAGQVYRLYRAAFDRAPDARGMGFWLQNMDKGVPLDAVARAFAATDEFVKLNLTVSSTYAIVVNLYRNILHREPDAADIAFWGDALDSQRASLADLLVAFSESAEHRETHATLIANGIPYEL